MDSWCKSYSESSPALTSWLQPSDRVIVIQGNLKLIEELRKSSVNYLNICVSPGLLLELEGDKRTVPLSLLKAKPEFNANKMINGSSLISPNKLASVLQQVKGHLSKQCDICFWYENSMYYQKLLDKTSREQRKWPGQEPNIFAWDKESFESFSKSHNLHVVEFSDEVDPLAQSENFLDYKFVNGPDCTININEYNDRKELFDKKHYYICKMAM